MIGELIRAPYSEDRGAPEARHARDRPPAQRPPARVRAARTVAVAAQRGAALRARVEPRDRAQQERPGVEDAQRPREVLTGEPDAVAGAEVVVVLVAGRRVGRVQRRDFAGVVDAVAG